MPIEMPEQDPCHICQVVNGVDNTWATVEERDLCLSLMSAEQFEIGQCVVVPRRHAGTLVDLTSDEGLEIMTTAQRLMRAFIKAYDPLGVLLFQNNGVYSGQRTPHFHLHVVPRQVGSDWGVGPPQLSRFQNAGRIGPPEDYVLGSKRLSRASAAPEVLFQRAEHLRKFLA
jgi:diadenosine tetraphosphate (Ap4A) HIT family hydrolase